MEYLEDMKKRMKKHHIGSSFPVALARKLLNEPKWEY
jgi:hypothetical protein